MKSKHIIAYMKTAEIFAECSTARRAKVGAIIVKDDRIISIGYNGMPSGWDNNCENEIGLDIKGDTVLRTKPQVLHAEMNAISKVARSSESSQDAVMFLTHAPCHDCAKMIYQSGISSVYYRTTYRDSTGIEFLEQCNIPVTQIDV